MQIKDLITKSGTVNSAVIRRDNFKLTSLYHKIIKDTQCLNILQPTLSQRIRFLYQEYTEVPKCEICKTNTCKFNKNKGLLFKRTCSKKCGTKIVGDNSKVGQINRQNIKEQQENVLKAYKNNEYILLKNNEIKLFIQYLLEKNKSNVFIYKNDYKINELCSLIFYTQFLPLTLNISERSYLVMNNMTNIPKCLYCDTQVHYQNYKIGYSKTCPKCATKLAGFNRYKNHFNEIKEYLLQNNFKMITNKEDFLGLHDEVIIEHLKCNQKFKKKINNGRWSTLLCPKCESNLNGRSNEEQEIYNYIQKIYKNEVILNYKKLPSEYKTARKELDIFIPSKNIGIEYNGLYWHSEDRQKHFKKFKLCNNLGIHLIQINSLEWKNENYKRIFKNYLQDLLLEKTKIYARKCIIKNISTQEKRIFLNQYHFQGNDSSKIHFGLYYNDELVSVMTFGKPRFNKNFEYEIYRYCTKFNISITGGIGKLFNKFVKDYKPKSIISYSKNDLFTGDVYSKINFKFLKYSAPNFIWWKNNKVYSRYQVQKHKLNNIIKYDKNISVVKNLLNNGYCRYYDSGNSIWIWNN